MAPTELTGLAHTLNPDPSQEFQENFTGACDLAVRLSLSVASDSASQARAWQLFATNYWPGIKLQLETWPDNCILYDVQDKDGMFMRPRGGHDEHGKLRRPRYYLADFVWAVLNNTSMF